MPGFSPEALHLAENLNLLQKATQIILKSVCNFEACLRQINCDDKGVTALVVWGLDGFSHEKGEAALVIGAALFMSESLKAILGTQFSIGIATGSVFSGIVGNSQRCDGTILGVCVNNAARFMCLPLCEGKAICDEETHNGSKSQYSFHTEYPSVLIKGMPHAVKIFSPNKKVRSNTKTRLEDEGNFIGRDLEKSRISSIVQSWSLGENESILITGRSGVGKSALRDFCERQISNLPAGQSLEHQQKAPLFIFGEILRELAYHIKHYVNLKDITPSASKRGKPPVVSQHRLSNISVRISVANRHHSLGDENNRRMSIIDGLKGIFSGRSSIDTSSKIARSDSSNKNRPISSLSIGNNFEKSKSRSSVSIKSIKIQTPNLVKAFEGKQTDSAVLRSTKSTVMDHSAIVQYLNQLGEPSSSIELLKYIPGVTDSSEPPTQIIQDIVPRLSGIFAKLFESFETMGIKVALIFDDLQEWSKMYIERFNSLSTLSKHKILLAPFQFEAVEQMLRIRFRKMLAGKDSISYKLIEDILSRSQGVALVVNLMINMMEEDKLLCVKDGELGYVDEITAIELPTEAVGAVVSQFDKLPALIKIVLRLAAVSGQYFDLQDLSQVIVRTPLHEALAKIDCNPLSLHSLIINCDKYHFIKKGETPSSLAFSHYLIQQGILSTVIPSKRTEMHGWFSDYYEEKLKDEKGEKRNYFTQVLLFHLLQLDDQFGRKNNVITSAFAESASMFRVSEALEYYELITKIRESGNIKLGDLQKSKESRLLGQVYFEIGY
ncbi:hypothetical protein HK100_001183 [Physocladia obscura]|uniref:Guanylate cyclase domain-containing protein n=1 Tax=Physocladia obscura TaxID=109957 RepID=A0AAD5SXH0_9FUNG|nr:hypothetical protein HK100_001183 [Physocladia obscura]